MIQYITNPKTELEKSLLDQMFLQRAEAFSERREWSVDVENGREYDKFDRVDPLYIVSASDAGKLQGSARLLPTSGPHMMPEVFPELMGEGEIIRNPLVWELSRFSVVKSNVTISRHGMSLMTYQLLDAIFDVAYKSGVSHILAVYDVYVQKIMRRAGYVFDQLGPVIRYDKGLRTVAGLADVEENHKIILSRDSMPMKAGEIRG